MGTAGGRAVVAGLTQAQGKNHSGHSGVPAQFSILSVCCLVCGLAPGKCGIKALLCASSLGHFSGGRAIEHRIKGICIFSLFTETGWLVLILVEPVRSGHCHLLFTLTFHVDPQQHLLCSCFQDVKIGSLYRFPMTWYV